MNRARKCGVLRMMIRSALGTLLLLTIAEVWHALPVHAQARGTVSGSVSDASTGEPIPYAILAIGSEIRIVADSAGTFTFENVPVGTHQLTIQRSGYRSRTVEVDLSGGAFVSLTLALQPMGVQLTPLSVEGEATEARRHLAGFEERRRLGFGHHLTREEFEQWSPSQVTDVLRHVPSLRIQPNPDYPFGDDTRRYIVESRRDGRFGVNPQTRSECPVLFFVDGIAVGSARDLEIDNILSVYQIDAIETYVGVQIPTTFQQPGSSCGAVVFWTRQISPADDSGGPSVLAGLLGASAGVGFALLSPEGCRHCLIGTDDRLKRAMGNAVIFGLTSVAFSWIFFGGSDGPVALVPVGEDGYGIAASLRIRPE